MKLDLKGAVVLLLLAVVVGGVIGGDDSAAAVGDGVAQAIRWVGVAWDAATDG